MTRNAASIALLVLLAGCGARQPGPDNSERLVVTGNADEIVMPAAAPSNAADDATQAQPHVNLAPDGLSLVLGDGTTRQLPFGLAQSATLEIVSKTLGAPIEQNAAQECGAGPLTVANYRGGLGLYFQEGKFAGWDLDGREDGGFTTGAGIGIGATRQALEAAGPVTVEDSTLGIEFQAGTMSGLLSSGDTKGKVTNLWAGMTCIAR